MTILKIARMGHPILRVRASDVPDPTAPEVARLVSAMVETMEDADGTGLAAPQVHMPWRIVVYKVEAERAEDEDGEDGEDGLGGGAGGGGTNAGDDGGAGGSGVVILRFKFQ